VALLIGIRGVLLLVDRRSSADHLVGTAAAHAIPNNVEAAYRRDDLREQRRPIMADWANYATGAGGENVRLAHG
jgi:hypothetical protein